MIKNNPTKEQVNKTWVKFAYDKTIAILVETKFKRISVAKNDSGIATIIDKTYCKMVTIDQIKDICPMENPIERMIHKSRFCSAKEVCIIKETIKTPKPIENAIKTEQIISKVLNLEEKKFL